MVDRMKELIKDKKWLLLIFILLFLVATTVVLAVSQKNKPVEETTNNLVMDNGATEYVQEPESVNEAEIDTIEIPGYPNEIFLEEGQNSTAIQLVNPENNEVYFKFTISLGEIRDGIFEQVEVLYESDLVKPGQIVKEQNLKRSLEKGTHHTAIEIETYSLDTKTEMNGARTMTKLIVQ